MTMGGERISSRKTNSNSVYEARWLLGPILGLTLALAAVDIFAWI